MMGWHHVEWGGPKLEGLTLELGFTPLPTDLNVGIRHAFQGSVQEQLATERDAEGFARAGSWMIERDVSHALLPRTSRPEGSRGDLPHLKDVRVKIEKIEPVGSKPFSVPPKSLSLPTDLTPLVDEDAEPSPVSLPTDLLPRECEDVRSHLEPVSMPVTIDLSDTESEGSATCDEKCWVQESSAPDATVAPLPDVIGTPCKSLTPKLEEGTLLDCRAEPSKPLKRKRSVIDLDSIIDLEDEPDSENTFNPTESKELPAVGGVLANTSLVKKSESEEKPVGFPKLPMEKTGNSPVSELPDRKLDSSLEGDGPIMDSQVILDHQMEDPATKSEQQYVFDIGHEMDQATMEELMCDDDEDLDPDFMLDDDVDVEQNFGVGSCETNRDGLIPCTKDDQEEVPSWYLAQARRSEESVWRSSSVNSQQLSNMGSSKGFELGRGNAGRVLQDPGSLRDLNSQMAKSGHNFTELVNEEGAQSPQLGQLQIVPLPSGTADAAEALFRFVQASSARGVFQPPQINAASMTPQVAHSEGAASQREGAFVAQNSSMDSIMRSLVEGNVIAQNGALNERRQWENVSPKSEPVELDAQGTSSTRPGFPVKTEWPSSSAVASFVDSRERIINALKMFELGRMQMLQSQADAEISNKRLRADLKVACTLRKSGMWQNEHRPIGECPGVKVGDCFTYRIEMAIVGLHRQVQAGITVVPPNLCPYGKPVAGSVVVGGNDTYKDDKDMGETVIYSGQGGLAQAKKGIFEDQKLIRGNLALSNSLELGLPVRLIRGHKIQGTNTGTLYSYDGLYKVTNMAYSLGVHMKMVYTFRLERLPNQPPICRPSITSLLYPASIARYPLPLQSQAGLPTSAPIPPNQEQAWIAHGTNSQAGTNQVPNFRGESWTGKGVISQTESEREGWSKEYEEKPLYLLPRSREQ